MHEAQQYGSITTKILAAAPAAEAVYLLAEKKAHFSLTGIFGDTDNQVTQYHVLVLISGQHGLNYKEVNKELQEVSTLSVTIVPVTMKLENFTAWAGEGHPFSVKVLEKAMLLHSTPSYVPPVIPEVDRNKLATIYRHFITTGVQQMEDFLHNGQPDQASITGYKAFLGANLGIDPQLDGSAPLYTYCSMIMPDIPANPEKLLTLLKILT